jgi:hypothetical protein
MGPAAANGQVQPLGVAAAAVKQLQRPALAVQLTRDWIRNRSGSWDAGCRQRVPGESQANEPSWDPAKTGQVQQARQNERDRYT